MLNKLNLLVVIMLMLAQCQAQNVGVGNTAPVSKLDVSGDLALREGAALTVAAGANTLTLPSSKSSVYRLTGASGAFSISSISTANDGMLLILINATGQVMTMTNGTSIQTNTGANLVASGSTASVSLIYNATLAKWEVTAAQGLPGAGHHPYADQYYQYHHQHGKRRISHCTSGQLCEQYLQRQQPKYYRKWSGRRHRTYSQLSGKYIQYQYPDYYSKRR